NGAPVAGDDAVQVTSDVAEVISVAALLANDSDPDGDPLTLASFTQPANGTLIDNGDGTLTYTPNAGYEGPDSFTYTVTDGDQTDTATVNLTVAVTANLVSDDFSAGTLDPAWTFSGIDGDAALGTSQTDAFVTLTSPQGVPVSASGPLSTPRLMQSTNDGNFQIEAGFLTEPSQLFQEHGLLVYQDASTWIRFDLAYTSLGLSIIVGVISGGSPDYRVFDEVDTGSVSQFRITRNGDDWQFETSADGSAWTLVYSMTHTMVVSEVGLFTGSAEYNGQVPGYAAQVDYFETASDPIVNEDAGFAPINTAPDGVDDAMTAYVDTPLVIDAASDLLGNDSDPQGDPLTVVAVTQPANGTLIDNGDGTYTYTPDAGFEGTDSFQYTVSDGDLTDVATVTVNVSQPGAGITSDDFSTNSLDPIWTIEGPSGISGAVTGDPTDGFLELVTPDGSYDVWNTNNGARAMQAVPDEDFTVEVKFLTTPTERFQIQGLLVEGDAQNWLRFDTYTDGNKLYAFAASTVNGTSSMELRVTIPEGTAEYLQLTRSGDLWTFAYSQDGVSWTSAGSFNHAIAATAAGVFAGNVGNATGYTARVDYFESSTDPITNEDGDYVELNNPPDALDDFLTITHGQPLTFSIADLLANDSDQNEDPLSFDGFTQPANGTLVDNGDGTLTYTPNAGYEGPDSFEYTISDGELSSTATVTMREVIDLWYGETQTFGAPGEAQTWVNILGNVASDVTDLSYSLNGGAAVDLVIGPDTRRLQESGDFNIDIAYADLDGSAAVDVVTIIATLLDGSTVTQDVTVAYEDGAVWDANYAIDWDTVTNIQDVVQVVDGDWSIQNGGLRLNQLGYDRVVAFGDESWDNYELQMSVTTHDLTNIDPNGRDGGGFAIGMLWTGHTDDPISGFQPKAGWEPGAAFFYTNNDGVGAGKFALHPSENFFWTLDSKTMTLEEDVTYNIVVRVEQTNIYDRTYQIKIWEEGTSEPTAWTLEGTQTFGLDQEPATGSIYLNAHYQDVTFNDLSVVEITGDDIVKGTEGADVLAAVDTTSGTPGRDEIDVFVGYGGADVFVFGDADGDYYDDGDGATGGLDDYAFIYDFNASEDAVQLAGTENDYVLATDTAGLSPGTSVWRAGTAGDEDELVGVINDVYGLSLAGDEFIFAGDAIA
ncbi:MAG: cadherin-like domain-containing protein, partial [Pseudomonadota bacterium]